MALILSLLKCCICTGKYSSSGAKQKSHLIAGLQTTTFGFVSSVYGVSANAGAANNAITKVVINCRIQVFLALCESASSRTVELYRFIKFRAVQRKLIEPTALPNN